MWQIFSRMHLKWYFFLKMSFHLIFEVFFSKNRKIFEFGKVRKSNEETDYFEKKNAFFFLKSNFNIVGGRKISRLEPGLLYIFV